MDSFHGPLALVDCRLRKKLDVRNREILAAVPALQGWRHWLEGAEQPLLVWTDHKNPPTSAQLSSGSLGFCSWGCVASLSPIVQVPATSRLMGFLLQMLKNAGTSFGPPSLLFRYRPAIGDRETNCWSPMGWSRSRHWSLRTTICSHSCLFLST